MSLLHIRGGTVYDPRHGIDGIVADVWIRDGRVISAPTDAGRKADRTIDARGSVVMPGGVDMHCHIAGSKVNTARKMMPENARRGRPIPRTSFSRSGTTGPVPSTFATGYLYAGLGYTTAFDAAVPPLMARHAHEELHDTPIIDKGFYAMLGNNQFLLQQIAAGEDELAKAFVGWLIGAAKAYAVKIVNPGGVETWKSGGRNISGLDASVAEFGVTPRQILRSITRYTNELGLPHPVHIHCNNLGMPGNWSTTLDTMQSLDGHRGHLTHIQFHSYGGDPDDQGTFCSEVSRLAEYVNSHPNLTVDVGQVMFSETVSMTGDGAVGYYLHKLTGRKWFSGDVELEAGCGIVPITYKEKSFVHALQWAIGLEWYLLVDDPWRIAMSTDHPNGGSFLAYPEIISLLMSKAKREEVLNRVPAKVRERCRLGELDREYTLSEITIITRAAPAKMLGLDHKGHLGTGADGDVTIYEPDDDIQRMFEMPRYVISRGEVVIDDAELKQQTQGRTLHVSPEFDPGALRTIRNWFDEVSTIQFANYPVDLRELASAQTVPCIHENS